MTPDHIMALRAAVEKYNASERAALRDTTSLSWRGDAGPLYLAGAVRLRGLFVDPDGEHWADAVLGCESAYGGDPAAFEFFAERISADLTPRHELFVMSLSRGHHCALLAKVSHVTACLELAEPEPFPAGNWCRSWETPATDLDARELVLAALGVVR